MLCNFSLFRLDSNVVGVKKKKRKEKKSEKGKKRKGKEFLSLPLSQVYYMMSTLHWFVITLSTI
jgi:hypothetical protein